MAEPKTKKNDGSVIDFLQSIEHPKRREDGLRLLEIFQEVTGETPKMWGGSIVGFGEYHYVYASGREGDWPITGFSPRKQNMSMYIMPGFDRFGELLNKIGNYKTGKSCFYVNKLEDIDESVLRTLIKESCDYMKSKYPTK